MLFISFNPDGTMNNYVGANKLSDIPCPEGYEPIPLQFTDEDDIKHLVKVNGIISVDQKRKEYDRAVKYNEMRKRAIPPRLEELSKYVIQDAVGIVLPDIKEIKAEYIKLYNELRVLNGLDTRKSREIK